MESHDIRYPTIPLPSLTHLKLNLNHVNLDDLNPLDALYAFTDLLPTLNPAHLVLDRDSESRTNPILFLDQTTFYQCTKTWTRLATFVQSAGTLYVSPGSSPSDKLPRCFGLLNYPYLKIAFDWRSKWEPEEGANRVEWLLTTGRLAELPVGIQVEIMVDHEEEGFRKAVERRLEELWSDGLRDRVRMKEVPYELDWVE